MSGVHTETFGQEPRTVGRPARTERSAHMRFQRWGASQETGENRESCCTDGDLRSRASHGRETGENYELHSGNPAYELRSGNPAYELSKREL